LRIETFDVRVKFEFNTCGLQLYRLLLPRVTTESLILVYRRWLLILLGCVSVACRLWLVVVLRPVVIVFVFVLPGMVLLLGLRGVAGCVIVALVTLVACLGGRGLKSDA